VLRAFSAVDIALPTQRQSKRVRIEGEVQRPAEYVLPEGSSVNDALRAAGGITAAAYVFATEFNRISVQQTQQQNYERALRDLETGLATSSTSQRVTSGDEATALAARNASRTQLIDRLRTLRPTGRVVLQLEPTGRELPDLALEDGDRIFIPARPTTVGVFGSVFNAGTYLHLDNRRLGDYLRLAGGPTKEADEASVFMVRANGSVISGRQRQGGWFSRGNTLTDVAAEPGDTIFVPTEFDRTTFTQNLRDWTQILSQFALGAAALKVLGN
jgi:protein involved in polysaccharide export with SLBB domain